MKKFGYFLLIFVPFILAEALQFVASFYAMGMGGIICLLQGRNSSKGFSSLFLEILTDTDFNGMLMIIYSLFAICIFGLWYYIKYEADYLPLKRHKLTSNLMISLAGIVLLVPGAQFGSSLICALILYINPDTFKQYEDLMENAGISNEMSLILFIYSVILAPIGEELIYRGVTFSIAKQVFPFWLANIIQALLFGAYHMNLVQGCYAFALGLILGYVCHKGKSIYFSIFLHFLFNLWAAVVSPLLGDFNTLLLGLIIIGGTIFSLIGGFMLFCFGVKQTKKPLW